MRPLSCFHIKAAGVTAWNRFVGKWLHGQTVTLVQHCIVLQHVGAAAQPHMHTQTVPFAREPAQLPQHACYEEPQHHADAHWL